LASLNGIGVGRKSRVELRLAVITLGHARLIDIGRLQAAPPRHPVILVVRPTQPEETSSLTPLTSTSDLARSE
jgi:hypothetical protein